MKHGEQRLSLKEERDGSLEDQVQAKAKSGGSSKEKMENKSGGKHDENKIKFLAFLAVSVLLLLLLLLPLLLLLLRRRGNQRV